MQKVLGAEMVANGAMTPDLYNALERCTERSWSFWPSFPWLLLRSELDRAVADRAVDMAFPRVNMVSYQSYFIGGTIMLASFFIPGGAAKSGWTSYSPLATVADLGHKFNGQTFWIIGMVS